MKATTKTTAAKPWAWIITFGSAVLAVLLHFVGGSSVEQITGLFTITAILGAVYLLYKWGQEREPPSKDKESQREKEMKAEAGGYGGNGGGL